MLIICFKTYKLAKNQQKAIIAFCLKCVFDFELVFSGRYYDSVDVVSV